MDRDFKGVWIPKEIWLDKELKLREKYYLSVFQMFGGIKETEDLLAEVFSKSTITETRECLYKKGYIELVTTPEEAKECVLKLSGEGQICEWCGKRNYVLHEHHYPISKAKGGTKTVKICPNCHSTYHSIFKG